jgi:hypothetical protein
MSTMRDAIGEMIFDCGMFRPDVEKVMDIVVVDEKNLFPKALRWSDPEWISCDNNLRAEAMSLWVEKQDG